MRDAPHAERLWVSAKSVDVRVPGRSAAKRDLDRIVLHFLPTRSADLNPIESIGWHVHEEITRNHRSRTMDELLDQVSEWLVYRRPFEVERDA